MKTDIDLVFDKLSSQKFVGLRYLSKSLNLEREKIESWINILEQRGLVEIRYPMFDLEARKI